MFPTENTSSPLSSIASLRRNWGNPPEVVLADWAVQLVELYLRQHDCGRLPSAISEEALLVDSQGRLHFHENPALSCGPQEASDPQRQISRLVRDWQNESALSDPVVADVWTNVRSALKFPVSPSPVFHSQSVDSLPQTSPPVDRPINQTRPDTDHLPVALPSASDLPVASQQLSPVSVDKPQKSKPVKKSLTLPAAIGFMLTILFVGSLVYWGSSGKEQDPLATASSEASPAKPAESATPPIAASDGDLKPEADELTMADAREDTVSAAPSGSDPLGSNSLEVSATPAIDLTAGDAASVPSLPLLQVPDNPLLATATPAADPQISPSLAEPSEEEAAETTPIDVSSDTMLPRRESVTAVHLVELAQSQDSFASFRASFPDGQQVLLSKAATHWLVTDPQLGESEPIAKVFVADQALQWQWSAAATKSALASLLPNALLEGQFAQGNSLSIALRKPAVIPDWDPQLEKGEVSSVYALGTAPVRTATIYVDVAVPAPIELVWESPGQNVPFRKGDATVVFSSTEQKLVQVRVQFAWTGSHRFILKHRSEIQLDPAAPWISANVEFLDRSDQQLQAYRLESQQRLAVVKDAYSRTRQEPQRSQLRLQRDALTATMEQIDGVSKRLTLARALLHQLQTSSQWKVLLEVPWPEKEPQPILSLISKIPQEEIPEKDPSAQEKEAGVPGPKKKEMKKEAR